MSTAKKPADQDTQGIFLILQTFLLFGPMTEKEFRFIWETLGVLKNQWDSSLFVWQEVPRNTVSRAFREDLFGCLSNNSDEKGEKEETIYQLKLGGLDKLAVLLREFEVPLIYNDSGKNDREIIKETFAFKLGNDLTERVINFLVYGLTEKTLHKKIELYVSPH